MATPVETLLYRNAYRASRALTMRAECFVVTREKKVKDNNEFSYQYAGQVIGCVKLWRAIGADKIIRLSTFKSRLSQLYGNAIYQPVVTDHHLTQLLRPVIVSARKVLRYTYKYAGQTVGCIKLWRMIGADGVMTVSTFRSRLNEVYGDVRDPVVTNKHVARLLRPVKLYAKRCAPNARRQLPASTAGV